MVVVIEVCPVEVDSDVVEIVEDSVELGKRDELEAIVVSIS